MDKKNPFILVLLTTLGSVVALSVLAISAVLTIIGISTIPDDAPRVLEGFAKLLMAISQLPWQALAAIALLCVIGQLYGCTLMVKYMRDADFELEKISKFRSSIDIIQERILAIEQNADSREKTSGDALDRGLSKNLQISVGYSPRISVLLIFIYNWSNCAITNTSIVNSESWKNISEWKSNYNKWKEFHSQALLAAGLISSIPPALPEGPSAKIFDQQQQAIYLNQGLPDAIKEEFFDYLRCWGQLRTVAQILMQEANSIASVRL